MQPQTITFINLALLLGLATPIFADQASNTTSSIPISNRDRVYTADQTSNTISVINPANNTLVGTSKMEKLCN